MNTLDANMATILLKLSVRRDARLQKSYKKISKLRKKPY
jgi:hypothetical protein